MTFAPRKRISLRRSTLNGSAMVTTSGYPLAAQTMARPIPVFPLVASMTVWPGLSSPDFSAASMTPESQSVLHRTKRIEGFNLDEEVDALRRQTIDPHHRRIADRFDNALVFPPHAVLQLRVALCQETLRESQRPALRRKLSGFSSSGNWRG